MKAIWNQTVIAESDDIIEVEGNSYFPESSVKKDLLIKSDTTTHCHWKGTANYYSIKVGDEINKDAMWYYKQPSELAKSIKDRVAFWNGVKITED